MLGKNKFRRKKNNIFLLKTALLLFIGSSAVAQQWDGQTLIATQNATTAKLIDTNSTVLHTWSLTRQTGYSSYLMPGGELVRTVKPAANNSVFSGGGMHGSIQKVDYVGTVTWDFNYSTSTYCAHHDICPMPNGNVLIISYELKSATEVAAAGSTFGQAMWPDKIVEVQPTGATTGTVVWEWHMWDHLVQNNNSSAANYQTSIINHPELIAINISPQKEFMHMNGIDYNPILDQIVFSAHNRSEIYVIDHSTTTAEAASHSGGNSGKGGDILYRWGKPSNYGATNAAVLNVVHDGHFVPEGIPGAGNIVGFNNAGISQSASCVDAVTPPYDGYNYLLTLGSAYTPTSYTARLTPGGSSSNMSNSQQFANGNQMVCLALSGVIKEFNAAGTMVWSYTAGGTTPQASRYSNCYVSSAAPAIPTVSQSGNILNASSATTYQWYFNGYIIAGATSQSYTPTANGNYKVRITDTNGCIPMYSQDFHFSTATNTSINVLDLNTNFTIIPNPSNGLIGITNANSINFNASVINALGKQIMEFKNEKYIDLSGFDNGIYYVNIKTESGKILNKKLVLIK